MPSLLETVCQRRVPEADREEVSFAPEVAMFCFPHGAWLRAVPRPPKLAPERAKALRARPGAVLLLERVAAYRRLGLLHHARQRVAPPLHLRVARPTPGDDHVGGAEIAQRFLCARSQGPDRGGEPVGEADRT